MWSNRTIRWVAANSGATNRHMCWSQPYPWAKSMGGPSGCPPSVTALFATDPTAPHTTVLRPGGRPSTGRVEQAADRLVPGQLVVAGHGRAGLGHEHGDAVLGEHAERGG